MLLDPLEKELGLPSLMIEFCNHYRTDVQCISEEYELSFVLFIPVFDAPDLVMVLLSGELAIHVTDSVGQDAGSRLKMPRPFGRPEVVVLLSSDHEVRSDALDIMETLEVVVTAVEDAVIARRVGICKSAPGCVVSEAEMECFLDMGLSCEDNIPQAFTLGQLSEHEDRKLVVVGELLTYLSPSYLRAR